MTRFLSTVFVLVVLAALSALSRQKALAQRSAVTTEGELGWKKVAPGVELQFLVARKEGVQSNSRNRGTVHRSCAVGLGSGGYESHG